MRQVIITGQGWPSATPAAPDPGQSPDTILEERTKSLISDLERSKALRYTDNWQGLQQMDNLVDRALEELKRLTNWREFCQNSARPGDIANLVLERDEANRKLNLYKQGEQVLISDLAEARRERDEMRTTLKQCRSALIMAHANWSGCFHDASSSCKLCRAMERINSIIPPSEI